MNFKITIITLSLALFLVCCNQNSKQPSTETVVTVPLIGTWKLVSGTLIERGDTTVTDYTKDRSFIKIINETHFAFLNHDLHKGMDSLKLFGAGGGRYTLKENTYTEHLEYCTDRAWEGHDFPFEISIKNDTLIQSGMEKIESEGIERLNIEVYSRVKSQ